VCSRQAGKPASHWGREWKNFMAARGGDGRRHTVVAETNSSLSSGLPARVHGATLAR
jgi:hypothetical protein